MRLLRPQYLQRFFSSGSTQPKVCVIGSGPAGFYFAQHLIRANKNIIVDIYERLPVPFGLVRYGVAPDHPEVKNVINTFTKTAQNPQVNFLGNVKLGKDISLCDLKDAYHAVVLTYGAEQDKSLGIPGEHLENIASARRFVGWYNGLPEDKHLSLNLDCENVAVIGQGNVAVDVARMLLTSVDQLRKTDVTEYALDALSKSRVKKVVLIGRRGPLQVAFTIKEFREMIKLPNVHTQFLQAQMFGLEDFISNMPRPRKRLTELLIAANKKTDPVLVKEKTFHPLFLRTPISFIGEKEVSGIKLATNILEGEILEKQKAVETDTKETLDCGLVLRSIGYKSVQADPDIPFDPTTGCVKKQTGIYGAGWLSTGPVGVILSTMTNAFETANILIQDIATNKIDVSQNRPGSKIILDKLKKQNIPTVDFQGWEKIDKKEIENGKLKGKPREKIVDVSQMLEIGGKLR
uniref:NADPH:adrenodoxin oxidoreductase, mitochondrial n=1 Tax=Clastoptera arizonana TaxID=38151 RepID=A0A1B6CMT6_9HEMI